MDTFDGPLCCQIPMLRNGSFMTWMCIACGEAVPCLVCRATLKPYPSQN